MAELSGPIRLKRSTVAGEVPAAGDLAIGELAINTADAKLFLKHTDDTIKEFITGDGLPAGIQKIEEASDFAYQIDTTTPVFVWNLITASDASVAMDPGEAYQTTSGPGLHPIDANGLDSTSVFRAWKAAQTLPVTLSYRLEGPSLPNLVFTDSYDAIDDFIDDPRGAYKPRWKANLVVALADSDFFYNQGYRTITPLFFSGGTALRNNQENDIMFWDDSSKKYTPRSGKTTSLSDVKTPVTDSTIVPFGEYSVRSGASVPAAQGQYRVFQNDPAHDTLQVYIEDANGVDRSAAWLSLSNGDTFDFFTDASPSYSQVTCIADAVYSPGGGGNTIIDIRVSKADGTALAADASPTITFATVTPPPAYINDGEILVWSSANNQFEPGGVPGAKVASVNSLEGSVKLGVPELIDTNVGQFRAPTYGFALPSTGTDWTSSAGGGGLWDSSQVRINRRDSNGDYDSTDYSYLELQEIRIYQTNSAGEPNGEVWTVFVTAYVDSPDNGGYYGFDFSDQGTPPSGDFYFRIGTGVLPGDGHNLSWSASQSRWISQPNAVGGVSSVNGETGVVSLGIQDMDDFGLILIAGDTWDDDGSEGSSPVSPGSWDSANNRFSRYAADGTDRGAELDALAVGSDIWYGAPGAGLIQSTIATARIDFSATGVHGTSVGFREFSITGISFSSFSSSGIVLAFSDPASSSVPLAEGDILKWNEAAQEFKPGPQVAIADGSASGSVLYWNGSIWGESDTVADVNGNINVGGLSDVDLSVTPVDKDSLVYEASSGTWKAINVDPATPLTISEEGGTAFTLNEAAGYSIVRATGAGGPECTATFDTGVEGSYFYLLNNTSADLVVTGSFNSAGGLSKVRNNGIVLCQYANSTWNLQGDLYDPVAAFSYTLEGATDYTESASKVDQDILLWDATNNYWTNRSIGLALLGYVGSTMKLQDISDVTLSSNLDRQYLVYNATTQQWATEQLNVSDITEDVQLSTNLDDLANVNATAKVDGASLEWNADSNSWVAVSGGGGLVDKADKNITFRPIVGDYTLVESDNNKIIEVSSPSIVTLPSNLPIGYQVVIIRDTSGAVSVAASGLIKSANNQTSISTQNGAITCVFKGGSTWYVFGDLS